MEEVGLARRGGTWLGEAGPDGGGGAFLGEVGHVFIVMPERPEEFHFVLLVP